MAVLLSLEFNPERTTAFAGFRSVFLSVFSFFYSTSMFSRTGCHLGTRLFNSERRFRKTVF